MNKADFPSKSELVDYIEERYPSTRSAPQQAEVVLFCLNKGVFPDGDKTVTTTEIKEGANATKTHINNLEDEVGLLQKDEEGGGGSRVYHERLDNKTIYGHPTEEDFNKMSLDLEMFVTHCKEDEEVRDFVANRLNVDSDATKIRQELENRADGDEPFDLSKYDSLVEKIRQHSDLSQSSYRYGRLGWRTSPNQYKLTWRIREVGKKAEAK